MAIASAPPTSWKTTKEGTEAGAMPAKVSENIRPTSDRRVGEAGRAGEEVGGADVGADGGGGELAAPRPRQRKDHQEQAEGGDHLGEEVLGGGAMVGRDADRGGARTSRSAEISAGDAATHLGGDVGKGVDAGRRPPKTASTSETTGLKWAPETGPNMRMKVEQAGRRRRRVLEQLQADVAG